MTKKLAAMSSLSQFSGIQKPSSETNTENEDNISVAPITEKSIEEKPIASEQTAKLVNINIKITKTQKDWLNEIAFEIRDNNQNPVPPNERVYPQHLMSVAIDLLKSADIDWSQIKSEKDLRAHLNL
ncbi:MAG: hypothetical protein VKJ02_10925 [Snowella sp.]|nr:hypothetical protein [Snowella sp.]